MAKRKRILSQKEIERRIKEGRGQGIVENYKPWLTIQDVPSKGRCSRIKGIKTNRQHELLSDMERDYFYILEFSDVVEDIREQYPLLPIEETLVIADELGIKHPTDPKTQKPIVMTTDFLITYKENGKSKIVARTIKSKDELLNERVIEKFEIERKYWQKQDVEWGIVTEEEINKTLAYNISNIHSYRCIDNLDGFEKLSNEEIQHIIYDFFEKITHSKKSIRKEALTFDKGMMLNSGTGLSIFKHLLVNKWIEIDMKESLNVDKPQNIIRKKNIEYKSLGGSTL